MSAEQNKAIIRRWVEEAWNGGNVALAREWCAPEYVALDYNREVRGADGLMAFLTAYRTPFPDVHVTILDMVAEGDKVVWLAKMTGTHRGEFAGIPPTGRTFEGEAVIITRFVNSKVVEDHLSYDRLGMMQQLGVIPMPAAV